MKRSDLWPETAAKLARAERASAKDGRLRYVSHPASPGFAVVTLKRPSWTDSIWTNGKRSGLWKEGWTEGVDFEVES